MLEVELKSNTRHIKHTCKKNKLDCNDNDNAIKSKRKNVCRSMTTNYDWGKTTFNKKAVKRISWFETTKNGKMEIGFLSYRRDRLYKTF